MSGKDMTLTDAQAEGRACIACAKPGDASEGQRVGTVDGTPVWACFGGCVVIAQMGATL
jgi:hypothetical protein